MKKMNVLTKIVIFVKKEFNILYLIGFVSLTLSMFAAYGLWSGVHPPRGARQSLKYANKILYSFKLYLHFI